VSAASETFIPFVPARAPATAPRPADSSAELKVLPTAEAASAFQSFASGSGKHLHPASAGATAPPKVTLQREGDRVTGIRVECICGQVIDLSCSY